MDQTFYGFYEHPDQPVDQPTYDPPHNAPCPFCGKLVDPEADVRTHSLMYAASSYAKRSYFYRTHRTCDEKKPGAMDDFILDMIARNGD